VGLSGFVPGGWNWANRALSGGAAMLPVTESGLYTRRIRGSSGQASA
jgi:hypothetical protein